MAEKSNKTIVKVGGAPKRARARAGAAILLPHFFLPTLCILLPHSERGSSLFLLYPGPTAAPEPKHGDGGRGGRRGGK